MDNETKNNTLDLVLKIIKWIYLGAFIIFSLFLTFTMLNSYFVDLNYSSESLGFGMFLAIVIIIIGSIGYAIFVFIGLVSLVVTLFNKQSIYYKKNLKFSIISLILPIVVELFFILIGFILLNTF